MLDPKTRKIGEASDVLDAIGHDNEKQGIKWTKHFMEEWDKKAWEEDKKNEEKLSKSLKFKRVEYHRIVKNMLHEQVIKIERPGPGYWVETGYDKDGVWIRLHDRWRRKFSRGFKPSGIPKHDYSAIKAYVVFVEDKMWELEDDYYNDGAVKTDSGVFLP